MRARAAAREEGEGESRCVVAFIVIIIFTCQHTSASQSTLGRPVWNSGSGRVLRSCARVGGWGTLRNRETGPCLSGWCVCLCVHLHPKGAAAKALSQASRSRSAPRAPRLSRAPGPAWTTTAAAVHAERARPQGLAQVWGRTVAGALLACAFACWPAGRVHGCGASRLPMRVECEVWGAPRPGSWADNGLDRGP